MNNTGINSMFSFFSKNKKEDKKSSVLLLKPQLEKKEKQTVLQASAAIKKPEIKTEVKKPEVKQEKKPEIKAIGNSSKSSETGMKRKDKDDRKMPHDDYDKKKKHHDDDYDDCCHPVKIAVVAKLFYFCGKDKYCDDFEDYIKDYHSQYPNVLVKWEKKRINRCEYKYCVWFALLDYEKAFEIEIALQKKYRHILMYHD